MRMGRIEHHRSWAELVLIRLFRRWAAAREAGENALSQTVELASELGQSPMVAVALDSLLQLAEAQLRRALEPECCCGRKFSADERALLRLIAAAPIPGLPMTRADIPHGLPGALSWAAASLKQLMGIATQDQEQPERSCPFMRV